ncbi:hypothetical protein Tsubulata_016035, partial [Turnera subulata]
ESFVIDRSTACGDPKVEGWNLEGEESDCCSWDGIECDDITGHVISLDLSSSCLSGPINSSSSLFQLLHLRSLNLAGNDFQYSHIPSALGHLPNLTHLNLSHSFFSGQIPSSISNLTKLSSLDLSSDFGDGLELKTNPDFETLTRKLGNLQVLHLDRVDMSSTMPNDILANSSSLVSLSLVGCNLQGEFPTQIFQLPKLEVLFLDHNYDLTGHLPEFHSSTPLRKLSVFGCKFSGHIPSSLQNLTQLVHLDLTYNNFSVQDASSLSWMGNLVKLTHLSLGYLNFNISSEIPPSFANLTNLSVLSLQSNQLSGPFPTWLANLTQLTAFDVSFNELRGMVPRSLSQRRTMAQWIPLFYSSPTSVFFSTKYPQCHDYERTGLLQFRESLATEGCAYPRVEGWNLDGEESDCCSWDGVECDNITGHVIGLDLSHSCLSGPINSSSTLFQLVHLRSLNLAYNHFQNSPIPTALGHLSNLTHLNLSASGFSGQIPLSVFGLSMLSSLDLSWNDQLVLQDPDLITLARNLASLEVLHLDSVEVSSTVPEILGNSASLVSLSLINCSIQGEFPSGILQLPKLEVLYLDQNMDLTGHLPEFHSSLPLRELSLVETNFSGELQTSIGNLKSLTYLDLSLCNFSGQIPSSLGNLPQLVFLSLSQNSFSVPNISSLEWISKLHKLTHLDLSYLGIPGEIPSSFANLTKLSHLDLSRNQLTGPVPTWHVNLTQLINFYLGFNAFQGMIPRSLSKLENLEEIDLAFNNFSGVVEFETFLKLKKLRRLGLSANNLSLNLKTGPNTTFPKFEVLGLGSCNLSELPDFLRHQDELVQLSLSSNRISGKLPRWFWNTSTETMEFIQLSHNFLTGFEAEPVTLPWYNQRKKRKVNYNMARTSFFIFLLTNFLFYPSPTSALFSTNYPPCHDHEKSALLQFKESFIIDRCVSSIESIAPAPYPKVEGWKPDGEASDCCLWDGIECDDITGHVIRLDLSSSCLYGSINSSSSIFQLLHLRSLNLAHNYFNSSSIPSAFGHLPNLTYLNLSSSGFSGQIPSSISDLTKLSILDFSQNYGLELRNPDFKTLIEKLAYNLQVLHLDYVNISSIVPDILANSSSLVSLSLVGCNLQGEFPTQIFQLPKLEVLFLDHNYDLTGHLPEFYSSTPLRKLSVSSCNFFGHIPSSLQNLTQLVYLALGYNLFSVQDTSSLSWMGNLAKVTYLSLGNLNLMGEIPSFFANLTNLFVLDLNSNHLTGPMPTWLVNLTQLTVFDVFQNELQGMVPRSLSQLENLEVLTLSHNKLNGLVELDMFLELQKLCDLDLSWNSLTLNPQTNFSTTFP